MDETKTNPATSGIFASTSTEAKPEAPVSKVDHIAEIAVLANALTTTSPSGAESIRDQILQHCADIKDPKAYDARMAAQKKAHDDAEAASKKIREADKAKSKAA